MILGGLVCIRDGDWLDYCWRECVRSLLPVCDNVTICLGSGSQDNTENFVREWVENEPKLNLCVYSWPDPKGDSDFWVKWMNYGREHCPADYILELDADEILGPCGREMELLRQREGRFTVAMNRLNFWRDARHTIPHGVCLAHRVIRMGPQNCWLPSDGAHSLGAEWVNMQTPSDINIFHYGFLRRRDAFFRKAKALQSYFFDNYDDRLQRADAEGGAWMENPIVSPWVNDVVPYTGKHPDTAIEWLRERGLHD
jgi:hypothetical protein